MIKKLPKSLNAQMVYTAVIAAFCAAIVFFTAQGIGKLYIDKIYMSDENVETRKESIVSEFSAYAAAREFRGNDSAAIARWTEEHDYVTIYLYKNRSLNFRAGGGVAVKAVMMEASELQQYRAQFGNLYTVKFADGMYQIAVSENSQLRQQIFNNVIAGALASTAFLLVLLEYVRRLKNRIIRLSKQAQTVGSVDIDAPIYALGNDELTLLANEMNSMRNSVIEKTSKEAKAWQANKELITAVSHDLRTPMTALIGYLDLINKTDVSNIEKKQQFLDSAYRKAIEIKDLTDELFKYFLVLGSSDLDMNPEEFDADLLFSQIVGETVFDLTDAGFNVENVFDEIDGTVILDPLYLKRVFNNLESNVRKYADPSYPVMFGYRKEDNCIILSVSNTILEKTDHVESTKIGVRTIEKIIDHMNGSFDVICENKTYMTIIKLKLK